jgi:hypothetical protein
VSQLHIAPLRWDFMVMCSALKVPALDSSHETHRDLYLTHICRQHCGVYCALTPDSVLNWGGSLQNFDWPRFRLTGLQNNHNTNDTKMRHRGQGHIITRLGAYHQGQGRTLRTRSRGMPSTWFGERVTWMSRRAWSCTTSTIMRDISAVMLHAV